jgi:hypothetical protein
MSARQSPLYKPKGRESMKTDIELQEKVLIPGNANMRFSSRSSQ